MKGYDNSNTFSTGLKNLCVFDKQYFVKKSSVCTIF